MRIKYIVPFPFDDEGIANRAAQIPSELLGPDTEVECVPVRNSATLVDCYYEDLLFEKNLAVYDLKQKCASVRAVNIPPDVEALFTGKEEEMFAKLTEEGRKAIEEDGADIILLGSTTMH